MTEQTARLHQRDIAAAQHPCRRRVAQDVRRDMTDIRILGRSADVASNRPERCRHDAIGGCSVRAALLIRQLNEEDVGKRRDRASFSPVRQWMRRPVIDRAAREVDAVPRQLEDGTGAGAGRESEAHEQICRQIDVMQESFGFVDGKPVLPGAPGAGNPT